MATVHFHDISEHQGTVDFDQVSVDAPIMLRASFGNSFSDRFYMDYRAAARQRGIPMMSYHFIYPEADGSDARTEGAFFARMLDGQDDYIPFVDFEQDESRRLEQLKARGGVAACTDWLLECCAEVQRRMGTRCGVYLNNNDAATYLESSNRDLLDHPLWIAHWNVNTPTVPSPWGDWTLWQYTSDFPRPNFDGRAGRVDANRSDTDKLASVQIGAPPPEPEPEPPQDTGTYPYRLALQGDRAHLMGEGTFISVTDEDIVRARNLKWVSPDRDDELNMGGPLGTEIRERINQVALHAKIDRLEAKIDELLARDPTASDLTEINAKLDALAETQRLTNKNLDIVVDYVNRLLDMQ